MLPIGSEDSPMLGLACAFFDSSRYNSADAASACTKMPTCTLAYKQEDFWWLVGPSSSAFCGWRMHQINNRRMLSTCHRLSLDHSYILRRRRRLSLSLLLLVVVRYRSRCLVCT
jgi:hypothetical protein